MVHVDIIAFFFLYFINSLLSSPFLLLQFPYFSFFLLLFVLTHVIAYNIRVSWNYSISDMTHLYSSYFPSPSPHPSSLFPWTPSFPIARELSPCHLLSIFYCPLYLYLASLFFFPKYLTFIFLPWPIYTPD